ncbi:hypothetical protein [Runella sp.]
MTISLEMVGLAVTGFLTIVAFWLVRDIHKDAKDFYKANRKK